MPENKLTPDEITEEFKELGFIPTRASSSEKYHYTSQVCIASGIVGADYYPQTGEIVIKASIEGHGGEVSIPPEAESEIEAVIREVERKMQSKLQKETGTENIRVLIIREIYPNMNITVSGQHPKEVYNRLIRTMKDSGQESLEICARDIEQVTESVRHYRKG